MGTRHLICVVSDGEYKVAQYGQWDGYPTGQGVTVLEFLQDKENIERLKNNLGKVRFLDPKGVDKDFVEEYDKNAPEWSSDPDHRTPEQIYWFETFCTRNLGVKILNSITFSSDDEIVLRNEIDFAQDSLFCEWCYVVDLDNARLEVFEGFNKEPLNSNERFYCDGAFKESHDKTKYYPIKQVASFSLQDLPEKNIFLAKLEPVEEPA